MFTKFAPVPHQLRKLNQWFCWQNEDGKKLPKTTNGTAGKVNDPNTFSTFDEAVKASSKFTGIAFIIRHDDGFTGVDLDNCFDEKGNLRDWAIPIVLKLEPVSYADISPSGKGIKFLTFAIKPDETRCKQLICGPDGQPLTGGQQIECYDFNRFWTVTGDVYGKCTTPRDGQAAIDWLCDEYLSTPCKPQAVVAPPKRQFTPGELEGRVEAYLSKCDVPIQGDRNNTVFQVAGSVKAIVDHFGQSLSDDEIVGRVRRWATQCGLSVDEIEAAARSGLSNGTPREKKYPQDARLAPEQSLPDDVDVQTRTFAGMPAASLWPLAMEPIEWLVSEVLSADQPTIFGAKQKSLKTTLLTDLAIALATGHPWLNKFDIPQQQRVLLITGEASEKAAIRKIKHAAEKRNVGSEDIGDWIRIETTNFPTLPRLEDCMAIQQAVTEHQIDVVILDPLYMGLEGLNTANLNEVGPAMRRFMQHCRPAKVIIAHHVKKTASYDDAPNLEDLSQAGIAEFAGNYWLMGRMSEYRGDGKHELAVRYGGRDEQFGLLKLEFDERNWVANFTSLLDHREFKKQSKENEKVVEMKQRILRALERSKDGLSQSKLAEACSTKSVRPIFQMTIEELERDKILEVVSDFKSGNRTCIGFKLLA